MKTFNTSAELLASNNVGIGKTDHIPTIACISGTDLTYNNYSVTVSPVWVEAYALMSIHTKLKDLPDHKQQELLNAYAENRLALTHKFDNQPIVKTPVTGHYLSSDSLLSSYFSKVTAEDVQELFKLLSGLDSSMTKDSLLSAIAEAKALIVTESQLEAVKALELKEKGLILGRNTLETAGCFDVTFVSDKQLKASVPFIKADTLPAAVSSTLKHIANLDKLGAGCLVMTFDVIEG